MRKKTVLVLVGILAFLLIAVQFGCTAMNDMSKISNYGEWAIDVEDVLNADFHRTLPDSSIVSMYGDDFFYKRKNAFLGDLNFLICIKTSFPDTDSYLAEKLRYDELFPSAIQNGDRSFYAVQFSESDIKNLCDQRVLDGMYYNFEIVVADDASHCIEVLNARIWDNAGDKEMIEHLERFSVLLYPHNSI